MEALEGSQWSISSEVSSDKRKVVTGWCKKILEYVDYLG